jgi:hypothetical protein
MENYPATINKCVCAILMHIYDKSNPASDWIIARDFFEMECFLDF